MRLARRPILAIVVFALVAGLGAAGGWYQARRTGPARLNVTNGADRGPGTLREALFLVATTQSSARITLGVPRIVLETPLPSIVNSHGISIIGPPGGSELDAHALAGGPVLDVAAANTSVSGLTVRNCPGTAILVRAAHFRLESVTLRACDVGVDVAENASDLLITRNRFADDRVGVRLAASGRNGAIVANDFSSNQDAGIWAVRSDPDAQGAALSVRANRFDGDRAGIVAGNVALVIERNAFTGAQDAAIHLIGSGAEVRGNRIVGGPGMGIVAEGATGAVIEGNELDDLAAYGIVVRGTPSALLRANRLYNCAYGLGLVLGDARNPSTAADNVIIEAHYDGIDVLGDSPVLRRNQVIRPRVFALRVENFQPPGGALVRAAPVLDGNVLGPATLVATSEATPERQ